MSCSPFFLPPPRPDELERLWRQSCRFHHLGRLPMPATRRPRLPCCSSVRSAYRPISMARSTEAGHARGRPCAESKGSRLPCRGWSRWVGLCDLFLAAKAPLFEPTECPSIRAFVASIGWNIFSVEWKGSSLKTLPSPKSSDWGPKSCRVPQPFLGPDMPGATVRWARLSPVKKPCLGVVRGVCFRAE